MTILALSPQWANRFSAFREAEKALGLGLRSQARWAKGRILIARGRTAGSLTSLSSLLKPNGFFRRLL